ncbi:MAG: threonylcarbamoyl-AMP synthase [Gemmatimonas sp.]|nr:threonylcarbamoyl-AMP synthase [Gemmatimonas sp.]
MTTIRLDPTHPDPEVIAHAARILRSGGLVAFPTETVYGLGANALDPEAVGRIFTAKGRPSFNPLIVHCADLASARALAAKWPPEAERLGRTFWPGPLTLVVPKRGRVPAIVTSGRSTVALRVPRHPVAAALLTEAGVPIAAPSANPSAQLSPTRAEHVLKALGGRVDLVLDAGEAPVGIESTVVDLSETDPVLLRPGMVDASQLEEVLGRELLTPVAPSGEGARPSPGMLDRHYAPRARLVLLGADGADRLAGETRKAKAAGKIVGALLLDVQPDPWIDVLVRMPFDPDAYARVLYDTLHRLDDTGCEVVFVESVPGDGRWAAVRDRLARAAA